ncbi:MAG: histidine kinase dimerization/phospho-acceptor domain-containing protein [Pseudomonadota bacterium]|nr:histidine kinase dimerization/phospho-acceptor domain-containing protein [Pseudomonadota bacterium]
MKTSLQSSILVIGHPKPNEISLGVDVVLNMTAASEKCKKQTYSVIAFDISVTKIDEIKMLVSHIEEQKYETQFVVIRNQAKAEILTLLLGFAQIFRIVETTAEAQFEKVLTDAQEHFAQREQHRQLLKLLNEQNENLLHISKELEDRVAKRQQNIQRARLKLVATNQKNESLQRTLIALSRAKSIGEMESLVREALTPAIQLEWTRITLGPQRLALDMSQTHLDSTHTAPLFQASEQIGQIHFGRNKERPFTNDETAFMAQVAEALSLAIFRLTQLKHLENLKQQWESTFDAIKKPLSLIDLNFNVLRCNRAFAEKAQQTPANVVNKKCFKILFGRNMPCKNCNLGERFRLFKQKMTNEDNAIFDVTSQPISLSTFNQLAFVNIYHDITESLALEYKIVSSSKEAELGLIGSSMAHELNNPLGGIISFIHIIKMDMSPADTYYEDILEMEKAAQRCKEIINNLLDFSRLPPAADTRVLDLRELISQALKIFELRTKSRGIEVMAKLPPDPHNIQGNFNLLIQALGHLITMGLNVVIEHRRHNKNFQPEILIELGQLADSYIIDVTTNTPALPEGSGDTGQALTIDLQVTSQIIKDHFGQLDIRALDHFFQARVKLPRPENQAKSQEIDSQI